jgi:spore coat protein U-like protein
MPLTVLRFATFFVAFGAAMSVASRAAQAQGKCAASASAVNFGVYNPLSPASLDVTGSAIVDCNANATVTVTLSAGSSGDQGQRTLVSGLLTLSYQIYTNASRTTIWGDGVGGTGTVTVSRTGGPVTVPLYGRIRARQNVMPGTYTDMLVMTVIF